MTRWAVNPTTTNLEWKRKNMKSVTTLFAAVALLGALTLLASLAYAQDTTGENTERRARGKRVPAAAAADDSGRARMGESEGVDKKEAPEKGAAMAGASKKQSPNRMDRTEMAPMRDGVRLATDSQQGAPPECLSTDLTYAGQGAMRSGWGPRRQLSGKEDLGERTLPGGRGVSDLPLRSRSGIFGLTRGTVSRIQTANQENQESNLRNI
jgi:hypothetical protein